MRLASYVLVMLILVPVFLLGYPFYQAPILLCRGRVSGTSYEPFTGRLLYHLLGARPDAAALRLARGLPAANLVVRALLLRPVVWASKVTGYVPAMLAYPPPRPTPLSAVVGARCEFLDRALLDLAPEMAQVVILGAGWDTRAYGLLADRDVVLFEVDAPATQAVKRSALGRTGIDASHVTFVACDFNEQSWLDALREHGFDSGKRTFLLWEGVTMYLEEHAIESTLRDVASLPPRSAIAFDFFSREWLATTRAGRCARWAVKAFYGEPFTFGVPVQPEFDECLSRFVGAAGLVLERARPLGHEGKGELPYGGLALAAVPA